eukprot:754394-Hanusia_phi.AAC.1
MRYEGESRRRTSGTCLGKLGRSPRKAGRGLGGRKGGRRATNLKRRADGLMQPGPCGPPGPSPGPAGRTYNSVGPGLGSGPGAQPPLPDQGTVGGACDRPPDCPIPES